MIIECPNCKTAHSKGEQELASGAPIVCRRCGTAFAPPARDADPQRAASPAAAVPPSGAPRDLALDLDLAGPAASAPTAPSAASADHLAFDLDVDLGLDAGSPATVPPVGAPPAPASPAAITLELDDTGERRAPSGDARAGAPAASHFSAGISSGASSAPAPHGVSRVPPADATIVSPGGPLVAPSTAPLTPVSSPIPAPAVPFAAAAEAAPLGSAATAGARGVRARDNATRSHPAGARGNVFPREAWARFQADLLSYVRAGSWRVRVAAVAVAMLPVAVPAALVLALRPSHPVAYVSETEPLLGGPLDGDAYPGLGPVDRGGRVEVIETTGGFALVRDSLGRVGFLPDRSLESDAPEALPSRPFADCRRAPLERSTDRCHSRAKEQFDSCRDVCGGHAEGSACLEHCQRRFSDCLAACESEPLPLAPAPAPPEPKAVRHEPPAASTTAAPDGVKRKARRGVKAKKKPPR